MLQKTPSKIEKFRNGENLHSIENLQDVEKLKNVKNVKDIKNAEGVERVVEAENFEDVEVEDVEVEDVEVEDIEFEDVEAIVRLLILFRVHTVVHSGDQGGPCKASFAKYISHQTKAQKLKFDLKDLPYEVSDTEVVALTKLTERSENAANTEVKVYTLVSRFEGRILSELSPRIAAKPL